MADAILPASMKEERRCVMSTMSHEPSRIAPQRRGSREFVVPEMWASLTIVVMWLAVLFDAIFGPNIYAHGAGGDSSIIPSAVVLALFAFLATWVVSKHGFRRDQNE
jgi:hypothetical protein